VQLVTSVCREERVLFKRRKENGMSKCKDCELKRDIARAFDLHWIDEEDCPFTMCVNEAPVVRCKDCKYFGYEVQRVFGICHKDRTRLRAVDADDYCKNGERRTE